MNRKPTEYPAVQLPVYFVRAMDTQRYYADALKRLEETRQIKSFYAKVGK